MSDFANAYKLLSEFDSDKWNKIPAMKQRLLINKLIEVRNLLIMETGIKIVNEIEYLQLDKEAGVRNKAYLKQ